jgi:hypothetical protein
VGGDVAGGGVVSPEDLRKLADEATPGPWNVLMWRGNNAGYEETGDSPEGLLIALAPDLARLCAEQHEALVELELCLRRRLISRDTALAQRAWDSIAKLSELEAK